MEWLAVTLVYANSSLLSGLSDSLYITEVHFRGCQKNVHPLSCVLLKQYSLPAPAPDPELNALVSVLCSNFQLFS